MSSPHSTQLLSRISCSVLAENPQDLRTLRQLPDYVHLSALQLPKAPDAAAAAAAATAAAEAEARREARLTGVAAVRALRMALREVTTRLLVDRRWRAFAEPVSPAEVAILHQT